VECKNLVNLDFDKTPLVQASLGDVDPLRGQPDVKRRLSALQRGPFRFQRDNIISHEDESADYLFLVIGGIVRSCKIYENGTRSIVAFYLPGDLFGWSDLNHSIEAATDAVVLFIKRGSLLSLAARENQISGFLLEVLTNELRRAQEHALLLSRDAKCRVATFLTELSERSGRLNCLELPMSHREIADGVITGLEQTGVVARRTSRGLVIRDRSALEQLMD